MTLSLPWHLLPATGERLALELIAALAGAVAALVVLRFLHAPIFRVGVLVPPSCRHCGSGLRDEGDGVPERCSECGRTLDPDKDVRWMKPGRRLWLRWGVWGGALFLGAHVGTRVAAEFAADWTQSSPRSTRASGDAVLERMLTFRSISPRLPERLDLYASLRDRYFTMAASGVGLPSSMQSVVLSPGGSLTMARDRADAVARARAAGAAVDPRDEEWARRLALFALGAVPNEHTDRVAIEVLRTVHTPVLVLDPRVVRGQDALVLLDASTEGRSGVKLVEVITECRLDDAPDGLVVRRQHLVGSRVEIPATTAPGPHVLEFRWRSLLQTPYAGDGILVGEHVQRVPVVVLVHPGEPSPASEGLGAANPLDGALAIAQVADERFPMGAFGTGEPRLLVNLELLMPRRPFAARLHGDPVWELVIDEVSIPLLRTTTFEGISANLLRGPSLQWSAWVDWPGWQAPSDVGIGAGDHLAWQAALPLRTAQDRRIAELVRSGRATLRVRVGPEAASSSIALPAVFDVPVTVRATHEVLAASEHIRAIQRGAWPELPVSDVGARPYPQDLTWLFGW